MDRCKINSKTFTIAALIILLCLISLTGSTYALFTSNREDGTIGVITTAGNLKVDIVDTSPAQNSLVNQSLQFYTSSGKQDILFEPGATFYTQGFKVKNSGDIHIQFRLSVSEKVNEEDFFEAFDVWILTDITKPSDVTTMNEFKGYLKAGQVSEETYFLFIKMKETAGNEFKNRTYTGIGVTLYAVQGNVDI